MNEMFKIKFWGRGGQGVVIASIILGKAAVLFNKYALSAPKFGAERGGAPVTADFRLADDKISARYPIANPDCIVVLDEGLITPEIIDSLRDNGCLIINSAKPPKDFFYLGPFRVATIDAKNIAAKYGIGTRELPITNTTILGAVAKALENALGITIDILCQAIMEAGIFRRIKSTTTLPRPKRRLKKPPSKCRQIPSGRIYPCQRPSKRSINYLNYPK